MAANQGTLVAAAIRPADDRDEFASVFANEGKGGYHTADNILARNSIPEARREFGMICYVVSEDKEYRLTTNNSGTITDNSNWEEVEFGEEAPVKSVNSKTGNVTITKSDLDLDKVTNDKQVKVSEVGMPDGVAPLDSNGLVPSEHLPSYVDDVVDIIDFLKDDKDLPDASEYEDGDKFYIDDGLKRICTNDDGKAWESARPESDKIYLRLKDDEGGNTITQWRWSGSEMTQITNGALVLGETDKTAYRGDRGKIAYDHTSETNNPHEVTKAQVGLDKVDNTSDVNKPISILQQAALDGKVDKEEGKGLSEKNYTTADRDKLAGIEAGAQVNVNADWNETTGDAEILNKPTKTSDFINDGETGMSEYIEFADLDASTLPSMTISSNWTIKKNNGDVLSTSTSNNLNVDKGSKVDLEASWKWNTLSAGQLPPTSTSGDISGTTLPSENTFSSPLSETDITVTTTFSQTMRKPKSGLEVVNGQVVVAEGNDSKSISTKVSFLGRGGLFYSTSTNPTPNQIEAEINNGSFWANKSKTFTNVTATGGKYTYIVYDAALGEWNNIVMDDAESQIGAFTKLTNVTITNNAGIAIEMIIYKSNAPDAFGNNKLTIT